MERKRQKKLRQKEQKTKEHVQEEQANLLKERIDNTVEGVSSAEQSFPLTASDSGMSCLEALADHIPSSFESFELPSMVENVGLEIQIGSGSDPGTRHNVERQTVQRNSRRHFVVGRWHLSPKSQWNHVPNGFHASQNSQASKHSAMQKHGNHRDSKPVPSINGNRKWSRKSKPNYTEDGLKTRVQKEAISLPDHNERHEVLIGSISVALGNCSQQEGNNVDGARDDFLSEHQIPKENSVQDKHNRPDSAHCNTNRSTIKLWRPVSRNGMQGPISVDNGARESHVDGVAGKIDDYTPSNGNCLTSLSVGDNKCGTGSFPLLPESLHPGTVHFSCQAAKAFLAESKWNFPYT